MTQWITLFGTTILWIDSDYLCCEKKSKGVIALVLMGLTAGRLTCRLHTNTGKFICKFLNKAHAGLWPVRAWFLEITFVRDVCMRVCVCVCVCVCPPPRLLITSGLIWCEIELLWLVKQVVGVSLSFIWRLKSWRIDKLVGVAFVNKAHRENCT